MAGLIFSFFFVPMCVCVCGEHSANSVVFKNVKIVDYGKQMVGRS